MPADGLKRLPDHVVAPLLRALMTIPHRPESRLYLRRAVPHRLHKTDEDYRVFRRTAAGEVPEEVNIGDIWLDPHPEGAAEILAPWRWSIDTTWGNPNGWWAHGRARSREEAMRELRNAWDSYQPRKVTSE